MMDCILTGCGYLRYAFSTAIIIGSAPHFFWFHIGLKGFSIFLPHWIYQKLDDMTYNIYQSMVLFFFENCVGLDVRLSGNGVQYLKSKEKVCYIGNHQSNVDWVISNMVATRAGSLGHLRYLMKKQLQKLPLYGYYFYQHGCLYISRDKFSQSKMLHDLQHLMHPKIQVSYNSASISLHDRVDYFF